MIQGMIADDGVPVIEVKVGGERWQAIIDTGFNGELELPERLRSHVNAQFVGRATSLLAANQRIEEDVYLVDFPFDGRMVRVQATFVGGDEPPVGQGLKEPLEGVAAAAQLHRFLLGLNGCLIVVRPVLGNSQRKVTGP